VYSSVSVVAYYNSERDAASRLLGAEEFSLLNEIFTLSEKKLNPPSRSLHALLNAGRAQSGAQGGTEVYLFLMGSPTARGLLRGDGFYSAGIYYCDVILRLSFFCCTCIGRNTAECEGAHTRLLNLI
jgi:hypothetical protein